MCRIAHRQSFSTWQRISVLFNLSPAGRERGRALKILHGETNRVIALRRQMLENEKINNFADTGESLNSILTSNKGDRDFRKS